MIYSRKFEKRHRAQSGYALLLVVFMMALVLIGTMSIGLRVYTEGKREKEIEMIWRGKQYIRGIKLHYRKFGRFPNSMDDLTKPKLGNIRIMRQEYKDPMNTQDGSWRLIYVGPMGQLIGSLKPRPTLFQVPGIHPIAPLPRAVADQNAQAPGTTPSATGGTPSGAGATGTDAGASGTAPSGTDLSPQPAATGDTPTIVGGNIIGVGSKIDRSSIIVYDQAKNYKLFEFIWDPSKESGIGVPPQPGVPGQTGAPGTQPPAPQNPNPLNPNPNPNPNPQNPNPQQ